MLSKNIITVKWGYYDSLQDMFMDIYTFNMTNDYNKDIHKILLKFKKINNEEKIKMTFIIYRIENMHGVPTLHGRTCDYKTFQKILKNEISIDDVMGDLNNMSI